MALKSTTYNLGADSVAKTYKKKAQLLKDHAREIDKVLVDARSLSRDYVRSAQATESPPLTGLKIK